LTIADAAKPSVELEDCVSQRPGHPDHLLAEKGFCEANAYQRLRTAGWIYSKPQEHAVPLYRCYNAQEHWHFASNEADCERLGTMERLLGYAVSQWLRNPNSAIDSALPVFEDLNEFWNAREL
jgi:hypothetical protein